MPSQSVVVDHKLHGLLACPVGVQRLWPHAGARGGVPQLHGDVPGNKTRKLGNDVAVVVKTNGTILG